MKGRSWATATTTTVDILLRRSRSDTTEINISSTGVDGDFGGEYTIALFVFLAEQIYSSSGGGGGKAQSILSG